MKNFDVLIVGSGITGALVAVKLARAGIKVLMLEAGPERNGNRIQMAANYVRTTRKTPGSPYYQEESVVESPDFRESTNPNDPQKHYYDFERSLDGKIIKNFKSSYQRLVGGSTWHWLGNVPRFIPNDFKLKTLYSIGKDWPITYDDLEPYYCEAEEEIGVSGNHEKWNNYLGAYRSKPYPMSEIWQCYGDSLFIENVDSVTIKDHKVSVLPTPQARNSENYQGRPPCAGNSSCVPICPIQAKYDATIHVEIAKNLGAELMTGAVVHKLIENGQGEIVKVIYRTWDKNDHEIDTRKKTVVLAAHSIETAKILLMSDVANSSDMVGRNLMDHAQGYVVAKMNRPVYPYRGPLTTSGIDIFRDGQTRGHQAAFRLSIGNDGWGRVKNPNAVVREKILQGKSGKDLFNSVKREITHFSRISYSTEVLPDVDNKVDLSSKLDKLGLPRPKLSFSFGDYNKKAFRYAREVCKEIFERTGAQEINILEERSFSGAGHIIGTTCMGDDPKTSVVDKVGKAHDCKNLYIVGASVFTTSGTANPTLTAAALSLLTADFLIKQLRNAKS